jgi:hypothetical protein
MNDPPCELVRVTTADGLSLDGALVVSPYAAALPVDAFLLVHGTGSNFYAPGILEVFARQATQAGAAVLRVNTRGHDGISSIPGSGRAVKGGAAYESIAECVHDLRAWTDLLVARGCRRIVSAGHSMGGVKAIFAQARDPHPHLAAVLAISPPRFCHDRLANGPRGDQFRNEFVRMRELVALGRPDALVPVNFPLPFVATPRRLSGEIWPGRSLRLPAVSADDHFAGSGADRERVGRNLRGVCRRRRVARRTPSHMPAHYRRNGRGRKHQLLERPPRPIRPNRPLVEHVVMNTQPPMVTPLIFHVASAMVTEADEEADGPSMIARTMALSRVRRPAECWPRQGLVYFPAG